MRDKHTPSTGLQTADNTTPIGNEKPEASMPAHPTLLRRTKGKQGGFTLIELLGVIIIIGALYALTKSNTPSPAASVDALLLEKVASDVKNQIKAIAAVCSKNTSITTPVADIDQDGTTTADEFNSMIFMGQVNPDYQSCYDNAGVIPMGSQVAKRTVSGNDEFWLSDSYKMSITGGGTAPIIVAYEDVPDEQVEKIAKKFNSDFDITTYTTATGEGSVYDPATAVTDTTERTVPLSVTRDEGANTSILKLRML